MRDELDSVKCSSCGAKRQGKHYNIWHITEMGIEGLRTMFPEGECDEMNLVVFSTSGVHGSYTTIEEIEHSLQKYGPDPDFMKEEAGKAFDYSAIPEDYTASNLTVTIYNPRLVGLGYGTLRPKLEDIPFLKQLRQSSWDAFVKIGRRDDLAD